MKKHCFCIRPNIIVFFCDFGFGLLCLGVTDFNCWGISVTNRKFNGVRIPVWIFFRQELCRSSRQLSKRTQIWVHCNFVSNLGLTCMSQPLHLSLHFRYWNTRTIQYIRRVGYSTGNRFCETFSSEWILAFVVLLEILDQSPLIGSAIFHVLWVFLISCTCMVKWCFHKSTTESGCGEVIWLFEMILGDIC